MRNRAIGIALFVIIAAMVGVLAFLPVVRDPNDANSNSVAADGTDSGPPPHSNPSNRETRANQLANEYRKPANTQPGNEPKNNTEPMHPDPDSHSTKVTLLTPAQPVLAWSLSKAEYERIAADKAASPEEQAEAKSRLLLNFFRWPGRDVKKLGGFDFDQAEYRVLDGYERQADKYTKEVTVHIDGNPPNVLLQRRIVLNKAPARIEFVIRVMASREWAQRYFLAWLAGPTSMNPGAPPFGSDRGIYIGDVCAGNAEDALTSKGDLKFVRHNVAISIEFYNIRFDVDPVLVNIVALAQEIDQEVQAQSHPATNWDDLATFCPVIDEFSFTEGELPARDGKHTSAVICEAHHPDDKPVYFEWKGEPTVGDKGGLGVNPGKPKSASVFPQKHTYEERPYKAWLVVYDDSLLFTLAEASVMIRPPKPK
jgi:hypothetical protein